MPRRLRLSLVLLALLLSALALLYWGQKRAHRRQLARAASTSVGVAPPPISVAPGPPIHLPVADAPDTTPLTAGLFEGRVLSSDTRRPIARAQLTFLHAGAALGVVADGQGSFRFVPPEPGRYDLQSITADGYAPFAPEFGHSPAELWARRGVRVSGLVLFLDPAAGAEKKTDPRGSGTISGLVLDEQERPQADADHRLVIGENDAQPTHRTEASGSRARTTNPRPGSNPAVRVPPRATARSVMPRIP